MASITLTPTVPDATVPLIRRTLARRLGKTAPVSAAELRADLEAYLIMSLKNDARQQKHEEAAAAAVADTSDGLETW